MPNNRYTCTIPGTDDQWALQGQFTINDLKQSTDSFKGCGRYSKAFHTRMVFTKNECLQCINYMPSVSAGYSNTKGMSILGRKLA